MMENIVSTENKSFFSARFNPYISKWSPLDVLF